MKHTFKFCPLCKCSLREILVDGCKRLVCQKCGWVNYKNPLPVVVCAVKDKEGKILIAKRNFAPGINKWALPGGFIESGENPEIACLRELEEETGIKGKIKKLVGIYAQRSRHYGSLLVIGYEITISKSSISLNNELKDAKFFAKETLLYIPFLSHRKIIKKVFENV
ncbi:MAG: NUDIX hydrolase [Candidatus Omnitrophica bacterium]|nr:NUDIX hydrolase [Candidatus Omnitrophota bacterium]